jgi:hypothetical protein
VKRLASLAVTILVAIVAVWVVFKLLGIAFKLIGVLIVAGLAFGAYVGVKRLTKGGGGA